MKKFVSILLSMASASSFLCAQPEILWALEAQPSKENRNDELFNLFFEIYPLESLQDPYQGIQAYITYLSLDETTQKAVNTVIWQKFHQENLKEMINHSLVLFNLENEDEQLAQTIRKQLNLIQDGSFVSVLSTPSKKEEYGKYMFGVFQQWAEPFRDYQPFLSVPEYPQMDISAQKGEITDEEDRPLDESDLILMSSDEEAPELPAEEEEPVIEDEPDDTDQAEDPLPEYPTEEVPVRDSFDIWKDFFELTLENNSLNDPYFLLSTYRQYISSDESFRLKIDSYFQQLSGEGTFNELFRKAAQSTLDSSTDVKEINALIHALSPYQDYLHLKYPETDSGNNSKPSGNQSSSDSSSNQNTSQPNTSTSTGIKNTRFREVSKTRNLTMKIEGLGTISVNPDFSNDKAWKKSTSTYNTPLLWGQCTWFAWGRFYELYGYSPGFTGNGYECATQLLKAHPDRFEMSRTPKAGAVFSSDAAHNHVGIVLGWDEATELMIIQEGNLDVVSNPVWSEAIDDWRTIEISLDELRDLYGNVIFANPILQTMVTEEDEEIVVTQNNSKIADINALVNQMAPLSISRYQAEIEEYK